MRRRKRILALITATLMGISIIGGIPVGAETAAPDKTVSAERQEAQNGTEMTEKEKSSAVRSLESRGIENTSDVGEGTSGKSSVTVYFTLSEDGKFVTGKDSESTLMCRVPVTVDYFDLGDYGLEDFYRYESDAPEAGGAYVGDEVIKQPTILHLYIKMLEQYYLGGNTLVTGGDALTIEGSATSMYMKKFWGHDENLMYFVNHKYPLMKAGWGATADYILLEDGMEIDVAMFTDWNFYVDGAFAAFSPTEKTVAAGEEFTLNMSGVSTTMNSETGESVPMPGETVVYSKAEDTFGGNGNEYWEEWKDRTDSSGNVTMSFTQPGTYYVSSTPLYETYKNELNNPCVAPPAATITVTGSSTEDDTGTENLTVLSNLYFSDGASAAAQKYTMTPDFDSAQKSYTVYVPDFKNTIAVWGSRTDEAKKVNAGSRLNVSYTNTAGEACEASKIINKGSGQSLAKLISKGEADAECRITAVCGKSSQEYTVNIKRVPSLSGMEITGNNGEAVSLSPEFSGSTLEYSLKVPEEYSALSMKATPVSDKYTVKADGKAAPASGEFEISLTSAQQTASVEVTGTNGETTTYKINIGKKARVSCSFENLLEGTVVNVVDESNDVVFTGKAGGGATVLKAKGLLEGSEYTYRITKKGYVGKGGSFTAGEADSSIDGALDKAAENTEIDTSVTSMWPDFRGNSENNGTASVKTPVRASQTQLLWAFKNGQGWTGAPSSPILVGDDLVFLTNNEIVKVDRVTGEIKKKGKMAYKSTFSLTPPTYADGMIFIALADGMVQAFNADTLESLWIYKDAQKGQPNSPITYKNGYIYTGFWNSAIRTANFVCLSATDENPEKTDEVKEATWTYSHKGGFYWAGAYASDNAVIAGSETGSDDASAKGTLYSFNPETGEITDKIDDIKGGIRSTIVYDRDTDSCCFTSRGGYFYSVKVNADGTFDKTATAEIRLCALDENGKRNSSLKSQSSSTPVIYGGRAYVGVTGAKNLTAYAGHNVTVIDLEKKEIAYCVPTRGYPQTSGLLTTAYEASDGYSYVYFIENYTPGILRVIKDKKGQTGPVYDSDNAGILGEDKQSVKYADTLFTPRGEQAEYAICSPIVDEYGTMYFKNDSSHMMALGSKVQSIEVTKMPDKTNYDSGEVFDPSGMVVTATLANGMKRDVTQYVDYSKEPLTDYDLEIELTYNHVMYNDKEKKADPPATYIPVSSATEEERAAVRNVSGLIDEIKTAGSYEATKAAAEKARAAYEELGYKLQQYIGNKDVLTDAEKEIANTELRAGTAVPVIKAAQAAYNSHKLTWNRNSKADGYEIYRSTVKGSRGSVIKRITGNGTLTMTAGTVTGTTYYYTLRPYILVDGEPEGDLYSACTAAKTVLSRPSLKAASYSYSSIKLTWSKVAGAQGYRIYRYSSKTKKYSLLKTITRGTTYSFVNGSLYTGSRYYYKITAVRGSSESSQSAAVSAVPKLSIPTSFKAGAGTRKAYLSWRGPGGASGYAVYRSTKSASGFKYIKRISTTRTTVKYTNTGLSKGRAYYYKIRAYRVVKGKRVYSSYTRTLKIRAR